MGYYSNIDIDRQNRQIDRASIDIERQLSASQTLDNDYDRLEFLDDMSRHHVTQIVTDETGGIIEVHQQLIPRFIVLASMAMSFCLAIAVFVLVSILLLGV